MHPGASAAFGFLAGALFAMAWTRLDRAERRSIWREWWHSPYLGLLFSVEAKHGRTLALVLYVGSAVLGLWIFLALVLFGLRFFMEPARSVAIALGLWTIGLSLGAVGGYVVIVLARR